VKSPYGDGKAAEKIVRIICSNIDGLHSVRKVFQDLR
jgi:UDP-N-acetylglucosamine 2-epimerase